MIAAALSSYRRRCLICCDRDATRTAKGTADGYVVCNECAQDMPVEMVGVRA